MPLAFLLFTFYFLLKPRKGFAMSDIAVNKESQQAEDELKAQEIARLYTVVEDVPQNHPLRKMGLAAVRIYDASLYFISEQGNKAFTKSKYALLKDGVATYETARALYRQTGDWSEEHEAREAELSAKAEDVLKKRDYIIARRDEADNDAKRKKAEKELEEFNAKHEEFFNDYTGALAYKWSLFSDTVEWQAREAKQVALLAHAICRHEGGDEYDPARRVWKDIESFKKALREEDIRFLLIKAQAFWYIQRGSGEIPFFGGMPVAETPDSATGSAKS